MHRRSIAREPHGFTLIELLVVIAIIAILAAILFPVFAQAREKARAITCTSNIRQVSLGIQQYVQDYDERFPAAWGNSYPNGTWVDACEPYMKAGTKDANGNSNWNDNHGLLHCPSDAQAAAGHYTSYTTNAMLTGAFNFGTPPRADAKALAVIDSPADVIISGEQEHAYVPGSGFGDVGTDFVRPCASGDPVNNPSDCSAGDLNTPDNSDAAVQFYSDWLRNHDYTEGYKDYPWNSCELGHPWVCSKYPSFRHSRNGQKSGLANFAFSDGHAKAIRWGALRPLNFFPSLTDTQKTF